MKRIYTMIPAEATRGQDRLSWLVFENNKLIAGFPSENRAAAYMRQLQIINRKHYGVAS